MLLCIQVTIKRFYDFLVNRTERLGMVLIDFFFFTIRWDCLISFALSGVSPGRTEVSRSSVTLIPPGIKTTLSIGRVNSQKAVCTVTTRTRPSFPLNIFVIIPFLHESGGVLSSWRITKSPSFRFMIACTTLYG